jgi:RNA polymerase sigma factor (sigma-70 family)
MQNYFCLKQRCKIKIRKELYMSDNIPSGSQYEDPSENYEMAFKKTRNWLVNHLNASVEDAEDCAINALAEAWERRLTDWEHIKRFVHKVAKHRLYDLRKKKINNGTINQDINELAEVIGDVQERPLEDLLSIDQKKQLDDFIDSLSSQDKDIFDAICSGDGLAQIAEKFGLTPKTIQNKKSRFKTQLKKYFLIAN